MMQNKAHSITNEIVFQNVYSEYRLMFPEGENWGRKKINRGQRRRDRDGERASLPFLTRSQNL